MQRKEKKKMNFKKLLKASVPTLLSAALLTGCSAGSTSAASSKSTVTVWATGSDNVRVQFEQQIEKFNESQDEYVAKLQFITSGTGAESLYDRVIAAKKAGQTDTDYDVIELGGDEVTKYVAQGGEDFFVTLDKDKIPNSEDLTVQATYRDDLVIPYRGTTVGIAYNSETVTDVPETAEELYQWIIDNPGRFAYNTPSSGGAGGSFVTTAVYNFLDEEALTSSDEKWEEQWDEGFNLLKELHSSMYQSSGKVVYPNKNQGTLDLLANKEVDMIPAWADMTLTQLKEGTLPESIKFTQITPSLTGNAVCLGIPSIGSNQDGAYAFINYMLSADAQNIALDTMCAIPVISYDKLDESLTETIKDLNITEFRVSSLGDLQTTLYEKWDDEIGTLN
jgi:putative spermidine/putrescine transport system substrate-binding protein